MTSEERHELRYRRRKQKRLEKKQLRYSQYDNFNEVFTYEHLYEAYKKCILGVRWKASVQKYILNASMNIAITKKELLEDNLIIKNTYEFYLYERGKKRHIRSVGIKERVVQRCLCDYSLVPMLTPTFIYDNGASMAGKGVGFSRKRLNKHLRSFMRNHKEGYVLVFDFKKYFDSIPHELILEILHRHYKDERIISLIMYFIKFTNKNRGLDLGSQISQILALAAANAVDHTIKDKLGFKYYGRYMDDSYIIHESKEFLEGLLKDIIHIADSIGITINIKKTRICKLSDYWRFLQIQYSLTDTGRIIRKINPKRLICMKRKMKKLAYILPPKEFEDWYRSWFKSHYKIMSKQQRTNMDDLFNELKEVNYNVFNQAA